MLQLSIAEKNSHARSSWSCNSNIKLIVLHFICGEFFCTCHICSYVTFNYLMNCVSNGYELSVCFSLTASIIPITLNTHLHLYK